MNFYQQSLVDFEHELHTFIAVRVVCLIFSEAASNPP